MYNHGGWHQVWWEHAGGPHDGYLGEISGWTCPRPTSKDRRLWVLLGSKQSQPVNPNTPHPAREHPQPGWEPRNADTGHPRVRRLRTRRLPSRVSVRVGSARHGSPPCFTLPTPVVTSRAPLTSLAPPPPTLRQLESPKPSAGCSLASRSLRFQCNGHSVRKDWCDPPWTEMRPSLGLGNYGTWFTHSHALQHSTRYPTTHTIERNIRMYNLAL